MQLAFFEQCSSSRLLVDRFITVIDRVNVPGATLQLQLWFFSDRRTVVTRESA